MAWLFLGAISHVHSEKLEQKAEQDGMEKVLLIQGKLCTNLRRLKQADCRGVRLLMRCIASSKPSKLQSEASSQVSKEMKSSCGQDR